MTPTPVDSKCFQNFIYCDPQTLIVVAFPVKTCGRGRPKRYNHAECFDTRPSGSMHTKCFIFVIVCNCS